MGTTYLNKNAKFQCQNGNAVWFKAQNGDIKTKINGAEVLTDNCSLNLIGSSAPGQCNLFPDPSTGAPSPCIALSIPGTSWINSTNVTVSGKKLLNSACTIRCPRQGVIKPFKPTIISINVDDNVSSINVSISDKKTTNYEKHIQVNSGGHTDPYRLKTNEEKQINSNATNESVESTQDNKNYADEIKYALCDYKKCKKVSECRYLKTSYELENTDESWNARILKENIGKDEFDLYATECGIIASTLFGKETYSIAHHHLIPANQCFKQYPEIVKLANYYGYDINNALNGICLPTMNQGYDKQPLELKLKIAFTAMKMLGKQWHKGPHSYSGTANEIECISKKVDDLFKNTRPFKDYKSSVDEYLEQFRNKLHSECKCRTSNYKTESDMFCNTMNHICKKIADKLRKFETEPKKSHSFFVSKIALYYAYYDILKDYQDIIFGNE